MFEQFVVSHPDFHPAHTGVADAHMALADVAASSERNGHLEAAATHYRRALDLELAEKPSQAPRIAELLAVLDRDRLNRPAEQAAIVRAVLEHYPANEITHLQLITSLLHGRQFDEMDRAIRAAGDVLPPSESTALRTDAVSLLSMYAARGLQTESGAHQLTPADARRIVTSAIALLDEGLRTSPESADLLRKKAAAIGLLARVEPDTQRARALLDEAAELQKRAGQ